MITFEEAESIRDNCLAKLSKKHKTKIIQINLKKFELGWVLSYKTENPNKDNILFGDGVIIIDANDGSTMAISLHLYQDVSGITLIELYKQEKYDIPIENEKERIENFFQKNIFNSEKEKPLKSMQEREEHKKKSFFYGIFSSIKKYLDS